MKSAHEFPVVQVLPELRAALSHNTRLVLIAPPGAGKTTQVPPALLRESWCTGRVLMLEPRRVAARAAASFMARALGEQAGETVGYRMRFEQRVSAQTRIEVVTEGILTRMLQADPGLEGVSAVVFDEFHERNLAADLGLAFCLDVQDALREDLRIVVMSATLDGDHLADKLSASLLSATGRSFPVETVHALPRRGEPMESHANRIVRQALAEHAGDILCFLPGRAELERCYRMLEDSGVELVVLHGDLGIDEQAQLLESTNERRVILATNVAESSLTIPGIRIVVDSGFAREPKFDPASGMTRLHTVRIAAPSAAQRAGRAGRLGPGICYRLWSPDQGLDQHMRAEINQVELSGFLLELKAWGSEDLNFLEAPPSGALAQARDLLRLLRAIDDAGRITTHGRDMLALGLQPRLSHAILAVGKESRGLACDIAALLEARETLRGAAAREDDMSVRVSALHAFRQRRSVPQDVHRQALHNVDRAARLLAKRARARVPEQAVPFGRVGEILGLAYPERIARRVGESGGRYRTRQGRGVCLHADSSLYGEPWLAISDLRFQSGDSIVLRAAALEEADVLRRFEAELTRGTTLAFDPTRGLVEAVDRTCLGAIELSVRRRSAPPDTHSAGVLFEALVARNLDDLPWSASLESWMERVNFLRDACPDAGLPDLRREALVNDAQSWLPSVLGSAVRVKAISAATLENVIRQRLDYAQQQFVEAQAPFDILVPSGARRKLRYAAGEAPVLAVKLQEMFGLDDGPRVACERVSVVLHLLSPRGIPIQITSDLRSFWAKTYAEVRKELKGRYPKHPWPDDPTSAVPTARTKSRR